MFYLWRMVPPSPDGIRHFFTLQNKETCLYETFVDKSCELEFAGSEDGTKGYLKKGSDNFADKLGKLAHQDQ